MATILYIFGNLSILLVYWGFGLFIFHFVHLFMFCFSSLYIKHFCISLSLIIIVSMCMTDTL